MDKKKQGTEKAESHQGGKSAKLLRLSAALKRNISRRKASKTSSDKDPNNLPDAFSSANKENK
ncbi:MAG: hypothetical protein SFT91_01335 [Rickettsiaceae bacterium]|nr:hypothetical protein [Rickettsiaceae bacterium]